MHITKETETTAKSSLLTSKAFRLLWVVILVISAFVLGYTLKPRPSRSRMMRPPALNMPTQQMQQRTMPPGMRQAPPLSKQQMQRGLKRPGR